MNSKVTIVLGLASAAGVFVGLFAGYAVIGDDPGRGFVVGLGSACLVLAVYCAIALYRRRKAAATDDQEP